MTSVTNPQFLSLDSSSFSSASLGEKFQNLSLKSNEELEKLTLKEGLSEVDRALVLLSSSNWIQKFSVVNNLLTLFKENKKDATEKILLKITHIPAKVRPDREEREFFMNVGSNLTVLLQEKLICTKNASEIVLPCAIKMIKNSQPPQKDDPMMNIWVDTFLAAIPLLQPELLREKVIPFACSLGELSQTVSSRVLCCIILGTLSNNVEQSTIQTSYFRQAMDLCQDTDFEVRSQMATQLDPIARRIGDVEPTKREILKELYDLVNDEEPVVKRSALQSLVSLLNFYDTNTRQEFLVPMVKELCKLPSETSIPALSMYFGELYSSISKDLEEDEVMQMYQCYKIMSKHKQPEIRQHCAGHLLSVLQCIGTKRYISYMQDLHESFARDEHWQVRRCVATSLHSVLTLLVRDKIPLANEMKDLFITFLRDSKLEVKEALVPNIDNILNELTIYSIGMPLSIGNTAISSRDPRKTAVFTPVIVPLLECYQSLTSSSWRLQEKIVTQFQHFHKYFPPSVITDKFVPLLMHLLLPQYVPAVRSSSAQSLCVLLRYGLRGLPKRKEICARLINEFGKSDSYWGRSTFIQVCSFMATAFSRKFFKETFFETVLDMASDPVPNVRMRVCSIFPSLKKMIRLPEDTSLLKKLNTYIAHLKNDRDRDVSFVAVGISEQLSHIEPSCGEIDDEADLIDYKKEEEEEAMFKIEEKEVEENKRKDEEARSEFRRRLAENEAEKAMRARIFGTKPPKGKTRLGVVSLPSNSLNTLDISAGNTTDSKTTTKPSVKLKPPSQGSTSTSHPPHATSKSPAKTQTQATHSSPSSSSSSSKNSKPLAPSKSDSKSDKNNKPTTRLATSTATSKVSARPKK
eukprot:TRINITY_DN6229_c0_g2_i1.p1 TRINITY_DN6229_c0_g2~~TRINITY_DN6229_c0_g2_i1.p1  ORF type:complete len:952 (-),score=180.52 TRINITY_DN6229_c0_g2_i1:67-2649(-)